MTSERTPETQSESPAKNIRRRGRLGLAIPWEKIPWWGIIILIVSVLVGYSMLNNARYLDALYFILDLPWNKRALEDTDVDEDGEWSMTIKPALKPGNYTLYAEFREGKELVGRSDAYRIKVPAGAPELEDAPELEPEPITSPSETPIQVETSNPTIAGAGPPGVTAVLYDDFSKNPWRIAVSIWQSDGVFLTIRVTLIAFVGALVIGLIFGLMRVSSRSPNLIAKAGWRALIGLGLSILILAAMGAPVSLIRILVVLILMQVIMFLLPAMPYTVSTLYVEIMRGVPMLVIILYMGFAVTPPLRDVSQEWVTGEIDLRGLPAAVIGLALGYGAYLSEIYRAGIESIPRGQMEAARSLGMSYFQAMRYVILPQAIRVVLPPLGNNFIAMLKDSSLISVIALQEILQQGRLWISRNFRAFEGYNSVAMLYLVMTLALSLLVRVIERRAAIE